MIFLANMKKCRYVPEKSYYERMALYNVHRTMRGTGIFSVNGTMQRGCNERTSFSRYIIREKIPKKSIIRVMHIAKSLKLKFSTPQFHSLGPKDFTK